MGDGEPEAQRAYRELGKGVALKGFRKGKVPRPVLEQVYGPRVNAEVAYELVRESFFRRTRSTTSPRSPSRASKRPTRSRRASRSSSPRSSRSAARSSPQDYKGLAIERRKLNIPESAVDESLAQLRREHTELRPIEGREVTAAGDIVGLSDHRHDRRAPDQPAAVRGRSRRRRARAAARHPRGADRHPARHQGQAARDPGPRRSQGRVRSSGRKADLTVTILEARAKDVPGARRRVRQGHRQGRHARRAERRAPQGARGQRARGDRSRGARRRAARADQEEPDPGRVVARRARGRDAVPAPAPDARHEARARNAQVSRRAAREDAAGRRRRGPRPAAARGDRRQGERSRSPTRS